MRCPETNGVCGYPDCENVRECEGASPPLLCSRAAIVRQLRDWANLESALLVGHYWWWRWKAQGRIDAMREVAAAIESGVSDLPAYSPAENS